MSLDLVRNQTFLLIQWSTPSKVLPLFDITCTKVFLFALCCRIKDPITIQLFFLLWRKSAWLRSGKNQYACAAYTTFLVGLSLLEGKVHIERLILYCDFWRYLPRGWSPKLTATGLNLIIGCSSKSIWVIKLSFCQNYALMGESFWQNISLVTHIMNYSVLSYLVQSQILVISL